MTRRHYEGTQVSESKSLLDIEYMLRRHGVETVRWTSGTDIIRIEFAWPWDGDKSRTLSFRIDLLIPLKGQDGWELAATRREAERRRLLRVLLNHIKAKLVGVEDGLVEMEREFLPYLIAAGNRTVGDVAAERLALGEIPTTALLLEAGGGRARRGDS